MIHKWKLRRHAAGFEFFEERERVFRDLVRSTTIQKNKKSHSSIKGRMRNSDTGVRHACVFLQIRLLIFFCISFWNFNHQNRERCMM